MVVYYRDVPCKLPDIAEDMKIKLGPPKLMKLKPRRA
jgi:hypothetical protein